MVGAKVHLALARPLEWFAFPAQFILCVCKGAGGWLYEHEGEDL